MVGQFCDRSFYAVAGAQWLLHVVTSGQVSLFLVILFLAYSNLVPPHLV